MLLPCFRRELPRLRGDFELAHVKRLRIRPGGHLILHCTSGCAWVTLDLEYEDRVLFAGDSLALPAGKGAFVLGEPECGLSLALPELSESGRRIGTRLTASWRSINLFARLA